MVSKLKFRDSTLPAPSLPASIRSCEDTAAGSYMTMRYNDTLVSGRAYAGVNTRSATPTFGPHNLRMFRVDERCLLVSSLNFHEVDLSNIRVYRRLYNHLWPCNERRDLLLDPHEPNPAKSGNSYFAVADYDLVRSDYKPDTDSLYAPTLIIDSFDTIDSIVTGRFVGRWFKDELCFSTTRYPDPDTVVITEGWFQTELRKS